MTDIELEAIIFPSIVTLAAAIQLTSFAKLVGKARKTYNISYPEMKGDENFERTLRAQQNTLEFFPIFMSTLWMSSLFFNQGVSAVIGVVYIYSRHMYVEGYQINVKDRLPGFSLGVKCLLGMAGLSVCGFVNTLLHMCAGIDLGLRLRELLNL